jgi:hypothetical protein
MFITKLSLPRRTFLRGAGSLVALPLLEAMVPAFTALAQTPARSRTRLGFVYIPNGVVLNTWTPVGQGSALELSPTLLPLQGVLDRTTVISGLGSKPAEAQGDGSGDHARGSAAWLSGMHAKRTEGADIEGGKTIDQIAADKLGGDTQFPSLELAIDDVSQFVGSCDSGYACSYTNTLSWRTPNTPLPMQTNPRVVFDRIFGDASSAEQRRAQLQQDRSILDSITDAASRLQRTLGSSDRSRVGEYLDGIREIERRIQKVEQQAGSRGLDLPETPIGIPDDFDEHAKLMFDLQVLAFRADVTRVITFMLARELSQRTYGQIGVSEPHHALSHHGGDRAQIEKLSKIDTYHTQLLAYFVDKLRATPDGDSNLLDQSLILFGGCMSDGNAHSHSPLPTLLVGGAGGRVKGGRHVKAAADTPLANLLVTILEKADVEMDVIGDSTGRLTDL